MSKFHNFIPKDNYKHNENKKILKIKKSISIACWVIRQNSVAINRLRKCNVPKMLQNLKETNTKNDVENVLMIE